MVPGLESGSVLSPFCWTPIQVPLLLCYTYVTCTNLYYSLWECQLVCACVRVCLRACNPFLTIYLFSIYNTLVTKQKNYICK
ncbi:hypothetical protein FKM82_016165 [Ascaphus truei]